MSWKDIAADPEYQSLPKDRKEKIRFNYFQKEIAPNVPSEKLNDVRTSFLSDTEGKGPSQADRAVNAALGSIGGILHRARQTADPKVWGALHERFLRGAAAPLATEETGSTAEAIAKRGLPGSVPLGVMAGIPGVLRESAEQAPNVGGKIAQTVAKAGFPNLAVPAGIGAGAIPTVAGAIAQPFLPKNVGEAELTAALTLTGTELTKALASIPSPEIPPLRYIYNQVKYKLGLPTETGLAKVDLREAVSQGKMSLADAMRRDPEIFKEEAAKRGLTPEQLKSRPSITPHETAETILKSEELHPGASKSVKLAPRTFETATNQSQVPQEASARLGAFQGQINQALGLPPGTSITPEIYHRALETGKVSRIEALELDKTIFKAEAGKEGIPEQAHQALYEQSKIAAQKPIEFKILSDLGEAVKSEAVTPVSPQAGPTPEFHQMTKEQFQEEAVKISRGMVPPELLGDVHKNIIEEALSEGESVPPEVLKSHGVEVGPTSPQGPTTNRPTETPPQVPEEKQTESGMPSKIPEQSLFPIQSLEESVTGHPDFVKTTQEAAAVVNRYANERGIVANPEFTQKLFTELHDAYGAVRLAKTPQEKIALAKELKSKYPNLQTDFIALKQKLWMDAAGKDWLNIVAKPSEDWQLGQGTMPAGIHSFRGSPDNPESIVVEVKGKTPTYRSFIGDVKIGDFKTPEEAQKAIDQQSEEDQSLQESEYKKAIGSTQTPVMDFARKVGLDKSKLAGYEGEAENLKGRGIIKSKGGMSVGKLAEAMAEQGLIPENDINMMFDALDKEARMGPKSTLTPASGRSGMSGFASKGTFAEVPPEPAELGPEAIKRAMPLEMPELVRLSKTLLGKYPDISKRLKSSLGLFKSGGPQGPSIKLKAELFQNIDQASKVLAHEIGHANDFFPEETMSRGNLIGRIKSFRKYLKQTFGDELFGTFLDNNSLRKELQDLSAFWRPWDREAATTSFIKYRDSAEELYADALSVFLNSPGTLQKIAPTFFKALLENLDLKPDFKEEWLNIQDILNGSREDVLKQRREDIRQMGMKSEEILIRKQAEKGIALQSIGERTQQALLNRYFPIYKAANELAAMGKNIPDKLNPKYVLEEGDMVGNEKALLNMALDKIINPLFKKYGIAEVELHEYGFNNRVLHDRSGLANPLGIDPKAARENLDYLKKELGDEAYKALENAFNNIQAIFWPVVEDAVNLGVISKEVFEKTILPNKGNYVTFSVLDYLEKQGYISAGIATQVGTLQEVGNTFLNTKLKTEAMLSRNANQRGKLSFKAVWDERFPGELKPTKITQTGGATVEHPEPGKEVLYIYEDGKRVAYDVDPYIAEAFNKFKPQQMSAVMNLLRIPNATFKLLYTSYNAGFVSVTSPLRYFQKTWKGLSGVKGATFSRLVADYIGSLPAAFRKARGVPDDFVAQLIKDKALDIGMDELELFPSLNPYYKKLKDYQLVQSSSSDKGMMSRVKNTLINPISQILHGLQIAADTATSAWKIAAAKIRIRAGQTGPELAYNVRNYAGIPNPRVKGLYGRTMNDYFLFSNILQRHYVTALQVLSNPTTRGGAWFKTAALDIMPSIIQTMAELGVLGIGLKEFYRRVSENDKSHYTCLPLGEVPGGEWKKKAMYMPIPHDDAGRVIHAITHKMLKGIANRDSKEFGQVIGEIFGSGPSVTPTLTIPYQWISYFSGGVPWDSFRQRPIIPDRVRQIGGLLAFEKMVEWTINNTGITNFSSYDPSKRTSTEVTVQSTPILNRLLRISDYGMTEEFRDKLQGSPDAADIYRLQQKKKQGNISREERVRLEILKYKAKIHRTQTKVEESREKNPSFQR